MNPYCNHQYNQKPFFKQLITSINLTLIYSLLGIAFYFRTINSFFISDDFVWIKALINQGPFFQWVYQGDWIKFSFIRPLISVSFFLDYKLWGLNPTGFHLTNILFHAANSCLVFFCTGALLDRLNFKTQSTETRLLFQMLAGFLFLVLPSHTEAVSWISARTDLISTFFSLITFYTYCIFRKTDQTKYYWVAVVSFGFALFSKESTIILPFVLIVYDLYFWISEPGHKFSLKKFLIRLSTFVIQDLVYLLIRYIALNSFVGGYGLYFHTQFQPKKLVLNLFILIIRTFIPYWPIEILPSSRLFLGAYFATIFRVFLVSIVLFIIILGFKIAAYFRNSQPDQRRKQEIYLLFFLWIIFVISLLPAINFRISVDGVGGERLTYLASAFGTIFLTIMLGVLFRKDGKRIVYSGLVVIFLSCLFLFRANENWRVAGEITKSILASLLENKPSTRLLILSMPQNIRGAGVFGIGIEEALYLYGGDKIYKDIQIVSIASLFSIDDFVKPIGNGNQFIIHLNGNNSFFLGVKKPLNSISISVDEIKDNNYRLIIGDTKEYNQIDTYSKGKLIPCCK